MKKESLIILGFLAVGLYFYYDKKKKDQSKPYSNNDVDLNATAEEPLSLGTPYPIIQPITHVYSELKEGMLEPKVIKLIPKK